MKIYPLYKKVTISGGSSVISGTINAGTIGTSISKVSLVAGAFNLGSENTSMAFTANFTVGIGTRNSVMTFSTVGADTISLGSEDTSISKIVGSLSGISLGSEGASQPVSSSIKGNGLVTTGTTAGGVVWTNPTRVTADDASYAQWLLTEGLGAGAGVTSTGTLTATNPALGTIPAGFTRTKVETLVHRNDAAVGLGATGDTASFTVVLQDKTGAALQTVLTDSFTAAGSNADATVVTDVTAAVAAVTDADLALTKFLLTATFARTLAAVGTRSWTVNVDSLQLRVTYTRSGIT